MSGEGLCVIWDEHHNTLIGVFEKLLERSSLVDCTIAAEGQYLKAHKVVLSACSPYFEMLFTQENEKNPIVVLKDIKFQDLKALIDFVYRGKVQIPHDRLRDFTSAAESLQIKGLGGGQKRNERLSDFTSADESLQIKGLGGGQKRKERLSDFSSAAELLQLKGLGGQKRNISERIEPVPSNSYSKEDCDSPISQKKMRHSFSEIYVKNLGDVAPNTVKSVSQDSEKVQNFPSFSTSTISLTFETLSSVPSHAFRTQMESGEKSPSPFTERRIECVSESRLEPMTEVLLPENECVVDPKSDVGVEEISILESDDEDNDGLMHNRNNEENSNSVYSSTIGIMNEVSDSSFPFTLAEQSNAGGCSTVNKPKRSHFENFEPTAQRKRTPITLETKFEVISCHERGCSVKDICAKYSLSSSTVCTILKKKELYLNEIKDGHPLQSTRLHKKEYDTSIIPEMEKHLSAWICNEAQQFQIPISYSAICDRASMIFMVLKDRRGNTCKENFDATIEWFNQFKERAGLQHIEVQAHADSGIEIPNIKKSPSPKCEFR